MAFGFQERDNVEEFDSFDPLPYCGGYDIAEVYGRIKPAAPECAYPRRTKPEGRFEASYDESLTTPYASAKPSFSDSTYSKPSSQPQPQGYGYGGISSSYGIDESSGNDAGYSFNKPQFGSSGYGEFQEPQLSEAKPYQEQGKFSYADESPDFVEDVPAVQTGYGFGEEQQFTQGYGRRPQSKRGEGYGSTAAEGRRPGEFGEFVEVNPDAGDDWGRKQDDEYEKPAYGGQHHRKGRHEAHRQRQEEDTGYGQVDNAAYAETGLYPPYGGGRRTDEPTDSGNYGGSGSYAQYGGMQPVDDGAYGGSENYGRYGGKQQTSTGAYGGSDNYGRHGGRRHKEDLAESTGELSLDGESRRPYQNPPWRRDDDQY